jgi:hypothetical protein
MVAKRSVKSSRSEFNSGRKVSRASNGLKYLFPWLLRVHEVHHSSLAHTPRSMHVLEEPTQLVGVAHDVDRANTAVGDVE